MKTAVGYRLETWRRVSPHLVYWFDAPDENGRQRRRSKTFSRRSEARSFLATKQAEIDESGPARPRGRITLGQLLEAFRTTRLVELSYQSQQGYELTMNQLESAIGSSTDIASIDRQTAERFSASRRRQRGRRTPLSSWAKYRHVTNCRAIFGAAVDWGWLTVNPFCPAAKSRIKSPLRIRPRSRPWHHITPDEFDAFQAEMATVQQRAFFWLMYGCGLRPGEAINVTIDRIDLSERCVTVDDRIGSADLPPFTVKGQEHCAAHKSRTVSIPSAAIDDITSAAATALCSGGLLAVTEEQYASIRGRWRLCAAGEVWTREVHRSWLNGDMPLRQMRVLASRCMRRAGVKLTGPLTLTTFRKSFAQNHADAGTPPRTLAKLLGHSDVVMTTTYYQRSTDANEHAAAATMDRLLSLRDARKAVGA